MNSQTQLNQRRSKVMIRVLGITLLLTLLLSINAVTVLRAQSLDLPVKGYGLSFGNSKRFNGLRLNLRDSQVEEINGANITLWRAKDNEQAIVRGMSLGLFPEAGDLLGMQIGIGIAAGNSLTGISLGLLGAASEQDVFGITIGGLGAAAGRDITGISVAGLGAASGRNMKGIAVALLGAGAGNDATGVMIGGLGAGAGGNITGLSIGGFGTGCGGELKGIAVGGFGVAASEIQGLVIGGFGAGGERVKGATLALGWVKIEDSLLGFTASAFNQIKGKQTGISLGIVNYAYELKGVQIGLVNYVQKGPRRLRVLPFVNARL
jgi:hypothetical protein